MSRLTTTHVERRSEKGLGFFVGTASLLEVVLAAIQVSLALGLTKWGLTSTSGTGLLTTLSGTFIVGTDPAISGNLSLPALKSRL